VAFGRLIVAATLNGVLSILTAVAFAILIFQGALAPFVDAGFAIALFSAAALGLIIALLSGYPGMLGGIAEPAAILGLMAAAIADGMVGRPPEAILATVVTTFFLASLATGVFLAALGHFKWGHFTRYIPHPVMGGLLAGIGWLLISGGVSTLTGIPLSLEQAVDVFGWEALLRWLPAALIAALLCLLRRRRPSALNLPLLLLFAVVAFWAVAAGTGIEVQVLREEGWLAGISESGALTLPHGYLADIGVADWSLVVAQTPYLACLLAVSLLGLLATGTDLELGLRRDIDLDREFKAAGIANFLSGLGAGLPGYQRIGGTLRTQQIGRPHRLAGIVSALICLSALFFGGALLAHLPKLVGGALLFYLGADLVVTWVVEARQRLSQADYTIVLLVFLTVALVGFLEGVGVGVVAGVILFAINYNRVDIVKNELSGAQIQSNVERAEALHRILRQEGERIHVMMLQGFLYFGTAQNLMSRLKRRAEASGHPPLDYLVLDASHVNGLDSSFAPSFKKLSRLAQAKGFEICLTNLPPALFETLRREGIDEERRGIRRGDDAGEGDGQGAAQEPDSAETRVRVFLDLDHGLEWCENQIIVESGETVTAAEEPLEEHLLRVFPTLGRVSEFMHYVSRISFEAGETLIGQGEESADVYFIESGRVAVELETSDGQKVILQQMGPGTAVGEIAFYLGVRRSASVVALVPSRAYRLSRQALEEMAAKHPAAAAAYHEFMAKSLALRLTESNSLIEALTKS
jgi:SulP family sulfate permease